MRRQTLVVAVLVAAVRPLGAGGGPEIRLREQRFSGCATPSSIVEPARVVFPRAEDSEGYSLQLSQDAEPGLWRLTVRHREEIDGYRFARPVELFLRSGRE